MGVLTILDWSLFKYLEPLIRIRADHWNVRHERAYFWSQPSFVFNLIFRAVWQTLETKDKEKTNSGGSERPERRQYHRDLVFKLGYSHKETLFSLSLSTIKDSILSRSLFQE